MATARELMRMAVDLGKKSIGDERRDPPPRVGVVFSQDGEVLDSGFRGDTGSGDHAEYGVMKRLGDADLSRVEVFTTLEPCSRRDDPKKVPCAERLANAGVRTVWIGMYDPNPRIYREGWKILRDAALSYATSTPTSAPRSRPTTRRFSTGSGPVAARSARRGSTGARTAGGLRSVPTTIGSS